MPGVLQVQPDAFYADELVRKQLGFSESTMARARKEGELKFAKRGHSILYRGAWLLAWLDPAAAPEPETAGVAG